MTDTAKILERLKFHFNVKTRIELAKKMGVSLAAYDNWIARDSIPERQLVKLAIKENFDVAQIRYGIASKDAGIEENLKYQKSVWKETFSVRIPFHVSSSSNMSNKEKLVLGVLLGSGGEGKGSLLDISGISEALNMRSEQVEKVLSNLRDNNYICKNEGEGRIFIKVENILMENS